MREHIKSLVKSERATLVSHSFDSVLRLDAGGIDSECELYFLYMICFEPYPTDSHPYQEFTKHLNISCPCWE